MFGRCRKIVLLRAESSIRRVQKFAFTTSTDNRWRGWEVVIGLEVHAQIKSRAKLFSHAWNTTYDELANSHVDIFDASFPGTLPKLNSTCVELAARTAIALNAQIQHRSTFDRKHYFYSDLPSGYQITQHYSPLAKGGHINLKRSGIPVGITQIQLEQDTAKTTFDPISQRSVIDLNRAGSALMEIVSEPDMRTPEQAGEYLRTLQALLRSIGSSDGNMDQGSLRCDVNVSVNRTGKARGTRCEIKNLNSVKFMMIAITSEALRHISLLENGKAVAQETRGFDEHKAETYLLRSKEDAPDYRYMPDPNLPPLLVTDEYIDSIQKLMPDLPEATRARLLTKGLSEKDVDFLMSIDSGCEVLFDGEIDSGQGIIDYFDSVSEGCDPKVAINWITHNLYGQLIARKETLLSNPVKARHLKELIELVESKKITSTSGKSLLRHMIQNQTDAPPAVLARELSLDALSGDSAVIDQLCQSAIQALPEEAEVVRKGNFKVLNKLVGYAMKASKGRADAQIIHSCLKDMLVNEGSLESNHPNA